MSAHTLGPWQNYGEDEIQPGVPCLEIARGEGGTSSFKTICYVDCTLDDTTDEFGLTAEDHANACLIAAAPLMLEALENIENDDQHMPDTAWELIQAAIAKARGQS